MLFVPQPFVLLGGKGGTGKTVLGRSLSAQYGIQLLTAGDIFRDIARRRNCVPQALEEIARTDFSVDQEIDSILEQQGRKALAVGRGMILDSRRAREIFREQTSRPILLVCDENVRMRRMFDNRRERHGLSSFEAFLASEAAREQAADERFRTQYGVGFDEIFQPDRWEDNVIDATCLSERQVFERACELVDSVALLQLVA